MKRIYTILLIATGLNLSAQTESIKEIYKGSDKPVHFTTNNKAIPTCSYKQLGNNFENGFNSETGGTAYADDIIILPSTCWDIDTIIVSVIADTIPDSLYITFMENNGGQPGAIANSGTAQAQFTSHTAVLTGTAFSRNVYDITCVLPSTITLCAGSSHTNFWFTCQVSPTAAGPSFWETQTTNNYNFGSYSSANGVVGPWIAMTGLENFVFELKSKSIATTTNAGLVITADEAGATYQWVDCNNGNAAISGETAQSFTATTNGSYAVEVTKGSCTEISACTNITSVGINETTINLGLSIYPSPTTGVVNFKSAISAPLNDRIETIEIYNLTGQKVAVFSKTNTIDISNLTNGVYFAKVITIGSSVVMQKLVKE